MLNLFQHLIKSTFYETLKRVQGDKKRICTTGSIGELITVHRSLTLVYCILLSAFCLLIACGKKGDPTLKSYEKPDSPAHLRAIHRESEIILFWEFPRDKEPTIKGFYLLRLVSPNPPLPPFEKGGLRGILKGGTGDFERIAFLENNKRSHVDKDFKTGSEYKYKIISQSLKGVMSSDLNIITITPNPPPSPPRKVQWKVEHNSLLLNWENAGNGILYNIYKSDKQNVYSFIPVNKEPVQGTSFIDPFDVKRTVYYTIRSIKGRDLKDEGPASDEIEINPSKFVPSSPTGLQAIVTEEKVNLSWKEAPETWVIGYRVYREVDTNGGVVLIGETQTPAFLDREKPLKKRTYRVTALGPVKEGPATEIRDVVFIPYR
ncbi:MAG: fibronectin type III domain-containing protein [Nitrospira sp.]|nr:fibronectin type III domain-containing protein [Nitrospira sp.]